jgi:hypothetical protein
MGYRFYLGSLPKKEYNKIKSFSLKELYEYKGEEWSDDPYDRDGYVGLYDIAYNKHYELGKYIDEFDKKFFKPVFKNKETQKHYTEENHFYIVQKEFVLELINYYTEKIRTYYRDLLNPFFGEDGKSVAEFMKTESATPTKDEIKGIYLAIDHIRSMGMEWGVTSWFPDSVPYNTEYGDIVGSWKYEYAIFNLVNLYRTFDWKRNVMIYYAY